MKSYPDIKVLATETGKWDEATGQQVMSNFLAAFPNLNGYWTQDGMAIGAMQAVLAANPAKWPSGGRRRPLPVPAVVGSASDRTIRTSRRSPWRIRPGVSPTGLRIAVNMLQGKEVDKSQAERPSRS